MNRSFKSFGICWAILVVMFNIIVFVLPGGWTTGSFWLGYIFIMLSFVGQLLCGMFSFKEEIRQKLFYKMSVISISVVSTIISIVSGTIFMVLPIFPTWIGVILCALILGFSAVTILTAQIATDYIGGIDDKVRNKTFFIKSLTIELNELMLRNKDSMSSEALKKLHDVVQFSDPMSDNDLTEIETQISAMVAKLTEAVAVANTQEVVRLSEEALILVNRRNQKCKMLK